MLNSTTKRLSLLAATVAALALSTSAQAAVTVLGWPGGSEETAPMRIPFSAIPEANPAYN